MKIIKVYVPEKVKIFIELTLIEELKYFQKKYSLKVEIFSDTKLIIPEYKIELQNKSKKLINSFENVNNLLEKKIIKKETKKVKKELKRVKKDSRKVKSKIKLKTLWVRRKKIIKSSL